MQEMTSLRQPLAHVTVLSHHVGACSLDLLEQAEGREPRFPMPSSCGSWLCPTRRVWARDTYAFGEDAKPRAKCT